MIALIQRVSRAEVRIAGEPVATVGAGLVALIGVAKGDDAATAERCPTACLPIRRAG
jgi:D-tyrosyl-tRNA(Tyr) deacylase